MLKVRFQLYRHVALLQEIWPISIEKKEAKQEKAKIASRKASRSWVEHLKTAKQTHKRLRVFFYVFLFWRGYIGDIFYSSNGRGSTSRGERASERPSFGHSRWRRVVVHQSPVRLFCSSYHMHWRVKRRMEEVYIWKFVQASRELRPCTPFSRGWLHGGNAASVALPDLPCLDFIAIRTK